MSVAVPTLETQRLRLRGWRADDIDAIAAFYADESTARFVGGTCSRRDAWRRMAAITGHWSLRGYGIWVIEARATGEFLGFSGLWCPDEFPEIEIGWNLLPRYWGQGYAGEAAARGRDFAFTALRLPTLVSYIVPENAPSQKVARKLGARLYGQIEIQGKTVEVWRHPTPKRPY